MSATKAGIVRGMSTAKIVRHLGELDRRTLLKAVSVTALQDAHAAEKKTGVRGRSTSPTPRRTTGKTKTKKKKPAAKKKKKSTGKRKGTGSHKGSGKGTGSRKGSSKGTGSRKGSGKGKGSRKSSGKGSRKNSSRKGKRVVKWDHALMSSRGRDKFEGMYAASEASATDLERFPQAHRTAWYGKTAFLTRLRRAQQLAEHTATEEKNMCVLEDLPRSIGSGWYSLYDSESGITYQWLDGLTHYISKHNVQPSHEFWKYITDNFWSP
jgi:hypothetical protein